jgi:hypothetical protein
MSEGVRNVTGMPRASVAQDASRIELSFDTDSGPICLSFSSDQFDAFANRAIQLFTHVRSQKLAIGGHLAVQPVPVAAAGAEAVIGGAKVIVTFLAENGVPFHFSLSVEETRKLRPQLRSAEESAAQQRNAPRQ